MGLPPSDQLEYLYRYPESASTATVRANMIVSLNGVVSIGGISGVLGSDADRILFGMLRDLADVIIVGAATAESEEYHPRPGGKAPLVVITRSGDIDPGAPVYSGNTLIVTEAKPHRMPRVPVDIISSECQPHAITATLCGMGFTRHLLEGGPSLLSAYLTDNALDQLCLTVSPKLVVGDEKPLLAVNGATEVFECSPAHLINGHDGYQFGLWNIS